jgi:hypothetical protein
MIMTETKHTTTAEAKPKRRAVWLIYIALVTAGLILIGDAFKIEILNRVTARLGIGLIFAAFALIVGNGRQAGYWAAGMVIAVIILTFFV